MSNNTSEAAAPTQGHYLQLSQSLMNVQPHLFFLNRLYIKAYSQT